MSDTDIRKRAPELIDRADAMLATYKRRGTTNVPGTVSLIRALAEALRAEMRGWAQARGDAVDFAVRAEDAERIVRQLAAKDAPVVDLDPEVMGDWVCMVCPDDELYDPTRSSADVVHHEDCPWRQAREWVEAHPETT